MHCERQRNKSFWVIAINSLTSPNVAKAGNKLIKFWN